MARKSLIHCWNKVSIHAHFKDVAQSSRGKRRGQDVMVLMHGEKNDLGLAVMFLELPRNLNPSHFWHGDIQDDQIRFEL